MTRRARVLQPAGATPGLARVDWRPSAWMPDDPGARRGVTLMTSTTSGRYTIEVALQGTPGPDLAREALVFAVRILGAVG